MVTEIKNKFHTWAIVGFILSFFWFLSFAGLGLSIYALVDLDKHPMRGRGLAIAGIALGALNSMMSLTIMFFGW